MFKKIILSVLLLSTAFSFAQATLEHSYISNYPSSGKVVSSFYGANGLKYFTFDGTTKNVKIYDENHVQIKSFILPMDAVNSNLHEIFFITDHLFNSDNSFEFLYSVFGGSGGNAVLLCDDNGVILQTFANKYYAQLKKNSFGVYKLILNDSGNSMSAFIQNIDIYSLSGTLSIDQEQIYAKNISFVYPNPGNDVINILNKSSNNESSTLEIFNIEGKKIAEKKVVNDNEPIKLDISSFSSGMYIYKLNGETNKFIKE